MRHVGVTLALLLLVLLIAPACRQNVTRVNKDFIGEWNSTDGGTFSLEISSKGYGTYVHVSAGVNKNISGPVRVGHGKLKIGFKKLTIDSDPVYDQAALQWKTVLDGKTFTRY